MKYLWEVSFVTSFLLIITRVFYAFVRIDFVQMYLATIVAVLFLYVPILVLWLRGRPIDFLDRSGGGYSKSIFWFFVTLVLVFIPYINIKSRRDNLFRFH